MCIREGISLYVALIKVNEELDILYVFMHFRFFFSFYVSLVSTLTTWIENKYVYYLSQSHAEKSRFNTQLLAHFLMFLISI